MLLPIRLSGCLSVGLILLLTILLAVGLGLAVWLRLTIWLRLPSGLRSAGDNAVGLRASGGRDLVSAHVSPVVGAGWTVLIYLRPGDFSGFVAV